MSYLKRDKENILEHKNNQGIYSVYNLIGTTQTGLPRQFYRSIVMGLLIYLGQSFVLIKTKNAKIIHYLTRYETRTKMHVWYENCADFIS
jgi:hypothetical protein